ncbi:zincin-like metallopeptidase domain-containing protein [Paracoccus sp. CPCC 101403]|uniref:Zincin-like metallopeptidase domain-containing protein n=1 Tax=Paracoccus broussonetiae TaxID=3075834 RepID=A0ABU3EIV6_9RHOB|nr:zincin-like metallopeptidase domain-containing protein [Paracoccus sp. CPCC 101403]MDT1064182.1 zincin-like metallopeptidase domain-containing protein [Paracoccus sp. CPCC 101403]
MAFDLYQRVTDSIVASINAGSPAWRKPWTGEGRAVQMPLRANGEAYRGINVLMLWLAAAAQGYGSAWWFTYKQAEAAGGQVRKGEKSATVVKYGTVAREDEESGAEKRIPYLKSYRVFNADQIDGLPEGFHAAPPQPVCDLGTRPDPRLEAFFAATGADIRSTAEPQAYYDPRADFIHMPMISSFHDAAGFYATLAHEACHWTGHGSRLDRLSRFAERKAYAFEELIAEIGNCMLCAQLGLVPDFGQSAAYVESWLRALQDDKRMIFKAATEAQKAADFLLSCVGEGGLIQQGEAA